MVFIAETSHKHRRNIAESPDLIKLIDTVIDILTTLKSGFGDF
jgi:hypothetical protein